MGNLFCKREKEIHDDDSRGIRRHSEHNQGSLKIINVHVEEMEKYSWLPAI